MPNTMDGGIGDRIGFDNVSMKKRVECRNVFIYRYLVYVGLKQFGLQIGIGGLVVIIPL